MAPKLLHLWRHSQKIRNPQPKQFLRLQTRWLADPFEPLNSSLAQSAEDLWRWWGNQQLVVLYQFQSTNISYPGFQSVKHKQKLIWEKIFVQYFLLKVLKLLTISTLLCLLQFLLLVKIKLELRFCKIFSCKFHGHNDRIPTWYNSVPMQYWFSRPWKSNKFGWNVHKVWKCQIHPVRHSNLLFADDDSFADIFCFVFHE